MKEGIYESRASAFVWLRVGRLSGSLACFMGISDLGWRCAVADFVFRLHMITPPYQVTAFSPVTATGLVLIAGAIGYVSGWFIGVVWNHFALHSAAHWQFERHEPTHAH